MMRALLGLGPLERWVADADVTEIMVNAGTDVWVERRGTPPQQAGHIDRAALDAVLEHMLAPVGRRLDRSSPIVDARLADGSRVCAVLPPIAVDGACVSVRRFAAAPVPLEGFADDDVGALLEEIVRSRCNVVVSGATSSGKTTLLNALTRLVPPTERIVTLEDVAELRLEAAHVLRLEARPASADGVREVDMATLLRTALRLRPDRLVIGEIRGGEAIELVQALSTGHDGSLATIHANAPVDALARIESLVVRENPSWTLAAVRGQVQRSIDVVVHVERVHPDGRRRVGRVAEVQAGPDLAVADLADAQRVLRPLSRRRS